MATAAKKKRVRSKKSGGSREPATAEQVRAALAKRADAKDAVFLQRFFKTGPGEYGEGDVFLGVRVPATREVVKEFRRRISPSELEKLLEDKEHEHRLVALLLLIEAFDASEDVREREALVKRYLAAVKRGRVNNWDLVDASAEFLVGAHLLEKDREVLHTLARSQSLWERRVAIVATFAFIKAKDASTTLALAPLLFEDEEDLLHKATGWMLREVGKRVDKKVLLSFLEQHAGKMPRTMLSYATEHLPKAERARLRGLPPR